MATDRMMVARLPPIGSSQANTLSPRAHHKYEGLTGPVYTIGGTAPKYNLPPPQVLKPYQDTKAGGLDTWPAHATGQVNSMTSVALNKDKQLCVVNDEAQGKPQMVPKPKFLEQLENFLKKELKSLGVDRVEPSELRLQAHREVFEYLIEDFKTYKPLLSAVKNEYEMMLAYQREQIRQMEPLKQMLVTVSEQCDQKIMNIRDQEKQEIIDLKQDNKRLSQTIGALRQELVSLETQVEKLREELAAEYLRYRDECDARKLLVADINDLRYQQEDMIMSKQSMQELDEAEKDDPITLKIALKRAREDEAAATKRLNEMEANYGDVIPRRDYEALEKTYKELEEKMEESKNDFKTLENEHNALLDVHKQVVQQRDEFYLESETLRRSATPRPDWDKCAEYVAGGMVRWQELAEGKTSKQLVETLLQEIAGSGLADAGGAEYFDGQGTGPTVPAYLRYEGQIRNRRLGKRDTALLVKDIWREKAAHDAEKTDGKREKLADFLHIYLQRRFGLEQMVMEWGYNLHDAAQRYSHDEKIGLFYHILTEEADEEVYHNQIQVMAKLQNHLTKLDVEKGNQGTLSKEDFRTALQEYFPDKLEESILALTKSAEDELEAKEVDTVEYRSLFMEDDEGNTGPFLEELKNQAKETKLAYVEEIRAELGDSQYVGVDEVKKAITLIDPEINHTDMENYLTWTFNVPADQLSTAEPMELSNVIQRLQNGNVRRIGKR